MTAADDAVRQLADLLPHTMSCPASRGPWTASVPCPCHHVRADTVRAVLAADPELIAAAMGCGLGAQWAVAYDRHYVEPVSDREDAERDAADMRRGSTMRRPSPDAHVVVRRRMWWPWERPAVVWPWRPVDTDPDARPDRADIGPDGHPWQPDGSA